VLHAAVLGAGASAAVNLGGTFMAYAIEPFAAQLRQSQQPDEDGLVRAPLQDGFASGGRVIGQYERLLIFSFILAESPVAIGLLVAAKSILRFGDLRNSHDRKQAEYVIIGTLMSFTYATLVAYATLVVLTLL
jgi:hypothetical protein